MSRPFAGFVSVFAAVSAAPGTNIRTSGAPPSASRSWEWCKAGRRTSSHRRSSRPSTPQPRCQSLPFLALPGAAICLPSVLTIRSISGAKLHIISTTTSFGARTVASRVEVSTAPSSSARPQPLLRSPENGWGPSQSRDADPDHLPLPQIWDVTHGRLCVSGVHNKMAPRLPTPTPESFHARL